MAAKTGTTWNCYDAATMSSKEIYGRVLAEMSKTDERIVGVTADLAKSTAISWFAKEFPERFYNVGIAEQNLMGVAAGMAKCGLIPFVSTFSIFASMRGGEQLRSDICYQKLNVKVIATHGGISFGQAGSTHHSTEDIAILRAIPNLIVIVPADGTETAKAVRQSMDIDGPVYIRIGRGFEPPLYKNEDFDFEIGKAITLKEGTDLTIIGCGITVLQALQAAKTMEETDGLSVRVIDMHTIKPIDEEAILKAVIETRRILVAEEHNTMGGLGDAVADVIARSGKGCAFHKLGIPDVFSEVGYPEDLYAYYKLDANGILDTARELMGREFEEDEDWEDEV